MNTLKTGLLVSIILMTSLYITPAEAESKIRLGQQECNVAFNYDLTVQPSGLIASKEGEEKVRIEAQRLYVAGQAVELNDEQQQLIEQYAQSVSTQVPAAITIAQDAMQMASTAVSTALTPLLGDSTRDKIDDLMLSIKARVNTLAYQKGDTFYLGATRSSLDSIFGEEFENEIQQLVQSAIGSIMVTLGGQMLSAEGGSFEEKMNAFANKMETMGEEIERKMDVQAKGIERQGELLCDGLQVLSKLERQVQQAIPELSAYSLVKVD